MSHKKPIIGLAGGIGSGKSFVARIFAELGCRVFDSDTIAKAAYYEASVKQALREWWGEQVFLSTGEVDKRALAAKIFASGDASKERRRLEGLIHPIVLEARQRQMEAFADDPATIAFVLDSPLLFETGLNRQCDAVVFVEADAETRARRLAETRGWGAAEIAAREKSQWPLDKKLEMSDYVVKNTADAADVRRQVSHVLSRILA
ncbi:MAG TPA: dephospho-CoA kinase [Tepidisphaeraceae bacterium]|nr:dephospho-CoA kinase [Tepidisphaeraceae bacterium]